MASTAAPSPAARSLIGACANITFLLLLAALFLLLSPPSRSGGGDGGAIGIQRDSRQCEHVAGAGDDGLDWRRGYPRGYINYLYLFDCVFGEERRIHAYCAMAAWLAVLFYLLGDTAAVYFCSSLEGLSRLLRLSPAIAGVTLLSLGNGAPDALSTIASFAVSGDGGETTAVGINGVLGSSMLVSSAVLGIIGLRLGAHGVAVDAVSFYRDAAFLLLALAAVAVVLAAGQVTIWGALAFTSLYAVYVAAVSFTAHGRRATTTAIADDDDDDDAFSELCNVADSKFYSDQEPLLPESAPLLLNYYFGDSGGGDGDKKGIEAVFRSVIRILEIPLWLPRRLTIPDASKERWSKPAGVIAVTAAPILLTHLTGIASPLVSTLAVLAGAFLGVAAFLTTSPESPPTNTTHLAAWHAAGFAMSVAWSYAVASELLALLAAAARVTGVGSAALGLTVLAWGNSLGDLVANLAVASRGGAGGAQVAVSGCYGGPVFDVLVGLGVSMILSSWAAHPCRCRRRLGRFRRWALRPSGFVGPWW
uniref:Sodium/calcium exchanger membrane region domain-containing protein n=1 Tax=Leersia perrieri TaxID=77586 RepID=A0A0D9XJY8_9ORYZ